MAELPTKEDLEKLYREKGHDALVWYAWRNSMRALSIFGQIPLQKLWHKTVCNAYLVCSVPLILSQWMQNNNAVLSIGYDLTIRVNHAGALSPVDAISLYTSL